jgi:catechol 2,3-dioxygenase-like lactoylglutathione lyase family enzyme
MSNSKGVAVGALFLAFAVAVPAQEKSSDPTRPRFSQASTNVFRRFAVDLAKMTEFYGDVLGLGALPAIGMPGGGQMTRFHAGTTEVKLQPSASEDRAPSGPIRDVTGLRVLTFFFPDEAALTARFKAHGLPAPEFQRGRESTRSAFVTDPSGQWVELVAMPDAPPATFDRIEIGLTVSDLTKSRAFYRDFVGLEEQKPVVDARLGATKYPFRLGTTTINLWSFGKADRANTTSAGIQYVVVNVVDIDARAKAQQIKIDRPLGNFSANLRTVWLSDPDGITNYFAQVAGRPEVAER